MSQMFREWLRKVGSGTHTHQDLSRDEAASATRQMLLGEATPAQIGAFLIAHRIKRPTAAELAGMLDAYDDLGPTLPDLGVPLVILGNPYDGRTRTAPLTVLTSLVIAAAGRPVLMHGSTVCPTKYGLPLIQVWQMLGIDWAGRSLTALVKVLEATRLGLLYLPDHFPEAEAMMIYRDQLGKRPPLATLELMWHPYEGVAHVVSGYVHPPTETLIRDTLALRAVSHLTTIKGLEGSSDLPRNRAAIVGFGEPWSHLVLKALEHGLGGPEIALQPPLDLGQATGEVLAGRPGVLWEAALWNAGTYLWHLGCCPTLAEGLAAAEVAFQSGQVANHLEILRGALARSPVL
ncbi:MAG: anthranilate phosphoribosyltransferase family protein [Gloeomargaritaceae cyanobacterium C42_A2020_066]|nr:anthranilate phosphoribosyltransferase family protein [Gloeomargaritaceae cyanobacterium C42_A2020_066]